VNLRWHTQLGYVPIPKSSDQKRLAENLDIFGFTLASEELAALGALDRPDPDMLDADRF